MTSTQDLAGIIRDALAKMHDELAQLGRVEGDEAREVERVTAAPVTAAEAVDALVEVARRHVASVRESLGLEILDLAKHPALFAEGNGRALADALAARLAARIPLDTLLLASIDDDQVTRSIEACARSVEWHTNAVALPDRPALIDAAQERGREAIARIAEIRGQAAQAGVLL